jgi:hypothetical protein
VREVHLLDRVASLKEHGPLDQFRGLEVRLQGVEIRRRKGRQQFVGVSLRDDDRRRLASHMTALDFQAKHILQRAGDDVVDTWFPCRSAMAAFSIWVDDYNPAVEVALVGREGAIGGIVSNGNVPAYATCQVRFGGRFLRIKTAALEQCKLDSITLRHWFSRYSDCLLAQIFQRAACNATHTIIQRTAKWLLAGAARTGKLEFEMTQDQLAKCWGWDAHL